MPIYDQRAYNALIRNFSATFESIHVLKGIERRDFEILRNKLKLYQLFEDRYVVAFTGLQGSGKTTLLQTLYGVDVRKYLPADTDRGERIPVLITESQEADIKGVPIFLAYTYEHENKGERVSRLVPNDITVNEFYRFFQHSCGIVSADPGLTQRPHVEFAAVEEDGNSIVFEVPESACS